MHATVMALPSLIQRVCGRQSVVMMRCIFANRNLMVSLASSAAHRTNKAKELSGSLTTNHQTVVNNMNMTMVTCCSTAGSVVPRRFFSNINVEDGKTAADTSHEVSYEEFKALLHSKSIQVIDIREHSELTEGRIKKSIHIPLGELKEALAMEDVNFQAHYGGQKPHTWDRNIVFFGLGPIKCHAALEVAKKVGYNHVRKFGGGWEEWSKREVSRKKKAKEQNDS